MNLKKLLLGYFIVIVLFLCSCAKKDIDNLKEGKLLFTAADKPGKNESRNDEFKKAVEYFKAELKNNQNSFEAQIYLADTYGRLLESDSSIIVLNKAIESNNKERAQLFIERGIQHLNMKNYTGSTLDFEEALKYDSKDNQIYRLIVHSKLSQKYFINGNWSKFEQEDIVRIINEIYPADINNRPSVDEFIYNIKMYPYRK
jgi:tetratricopeptide (TPR) repeat protein